MDIGEQISRARDSMTARTVYGDPVTHGRVTLVPAARVRGGAAAAAGAGRRAKARERDSASSPIRSARGC